jgi:phenylalanyl-tRNA synthetase beta chain
MHAFDYDKLSQHSIIVRNAYEGESLTTLFGDELTLDESMLVIADAEKAVAVAGIMGGEDTKVTEDTQTILFECANFNGYNIRQTSKKLGLRSDSSAKYTKGLDPNNITLALERAAQLIGEVGAGEVVTGVIDVYPNKREPLTIPYDVCWINKFLGTDVSEEEMLGYLTKLEFEVNQETKTVTVPTFRSDVTMMADLAEEVARLYGYDRITPTLERGKPTIGRKNFEQLVGDDIRSFMSMYGIYGALTYTFESPKVFDKLNLDSENPLRDTLKITNPLGEDFSIMRTTTLNGLLNSLATNYNRRVEDAALYEIGKIYTKQGADTLPGEVKKLTIGMYGKKTDFFTLKGVIEALIERLHITGMEVNRNSELPFMHPGRCADLILNGQNAGFFGEVHPVVTKNYDLDVKVYIAEIDFKTLLQNISTDIVFKQLPKYPATTRDIAMLVKEDVLVGQIEKTISERSGKLLEKVQLFDVYQGKQIEAGHKSVAYKLTFRAEDRTLTDEEVQKVMKKVLNGLEMNCGAKLRD